MEIIYNTLVLLHFVGLAALFGGFFVQMKSTNKVVNSAMFHGSLTQLVTGLIMVGLAESGVVEEDLNMTKISIKLLIVLIITGIVFANRKKSSVSNSIWLSIGLLTLANMAIAVYI
ncbi:MAG: hypothetical protein RLZZ37_940 [Actinomycetota bacterium]|jgi:cytochrome bd-type quinol oxidase subunit 2